MNEENLRIVTYKNRPLFNEKRNQCEVEDLAVEEEKENDFETIEFDGANNLTDEQQMEIAELNISEEYLESDQGNSIIDKQEDIMEDSSEDLKPFICLNCDKTFQSRSGRDTHKQLKHKIPGEFYIHNVEADEIETELETGELLRVWKCQKCELVSRKKSHHITHLQRHVRLFLKKKETKLFILLFYA